MNPTLALMAVTLGLGGFLLWFASTRFGYRLFDIMLFVWLYYAIAVPLDLIGGLHVPTIGYLPDLTRSDSQAGVIAVLGYYLLFAATFCLAYRFFPAHGDGRDQVREYGLKAPPLMLVLGVNVVFAGYYATTALTMSRQSRNLLVAENLGFKLMAIAVVAVYMLDLLYVVLERDRNRGLAVVTAAVMIGMLAGDRSMSVLLPFVYILRHRVKFSTVHRFALGVLLVGVFYYWKAFYTAFLISYNTAEIYGPGYVPPFSFSVLDGAASYAMFVAFLQAGDSPLWLGSTYVETPLLMSWPRFLGSFEVRTLAEQYSWHFAPGMAAYGGGLGFSGLAEAWLNFGFAGPALLGAAWGAVCRFFDSRPRGIGFFLVAMMLLRVFRSDFASLYKSMLFVPGIMLLGWLLLLFVAAHVRSRRDEREEELVLAPEGVS